MAAFPAGMVSGFDIDQRVTSITLLITFQLTADGSRGSAEQDCDDTYEFAQNDLFQYAFLFKWIKTVIVTHRYSPDLLSIVSANPIVQGRLSDESFLFSRYYHLKCKVNKIKIEY
jgi:hypothetical protein